MKLAVSIYEITNSFPREELFGLVSQIRRSAVSIPSNIAEGQGRNSPKDFRRFLSIAMGSMSELETQLELATQLTFITEERSNPIISECQAVGRMIHGLDRSLHNRINVQHKT